MTKKQNTPDNGVSFTVTVDDSDAVVEIDDWEPSHLPLSPSKINNFIQCPRSFYYRYIEKLPQKLTIHLFRGTIVHNILEDLFTKKFKYASRWNRGQAQEWVSIEFTREWNKLVDTKPWLFKDYDEKQFKNETHDMLINFCQKIEKKLREMVEWKVYRSKDMAFNALRPRFSELRLKSDELKIRGIVDVAVKDFEDNVSIIDYKTSKRYGPWLPEDYYRQLIIYALLYYEHTGVVPKFAGIDWLRYDEQQMVHITSSELQEARTLIKSIHTKITDNKDNIENYEMIPQTLCKWCAFYKNPCQPKGWSVAHKKKK